ncbi:hypothetical protein [Paracoccus beibuensis]|uniref:hypothetical protein n=1 Tax=Paracoccus beibuensis TaxID=547602 RepID=UPI002240702F|nr:hypothetical protein [Paracoccus beibuensis]
MTPLHPLAAAAVGGLLSLTAIFAPDPPEPAVDYPIPVCGPACLAASPTFAVGDFAPRDQVHLITHPGRYGLSTPPFGDSYAVIGGFLVRLDPEHRRIESVLRPVPRILD